MRKTVWDKIDDLTREEQAWVEHRNREGSSEIEKLLWRCRSLDIKEKKWKVEGCWIWSKPERVYPKKHLRRGKDGEQGGPDVCSMFGLYD